MGEHIYILGDLNELGNWKDFKCRMTWTEGHNWTYLLTLPENTTTFNYKFVCFNEHSKQAKWENGQNRVYLVDNSKNTSLTHSWNELFVS